MAMTDTLPLDPQALRADFPILQTVLHGGKRLVYFDNAATTQRCLRRAPQRHNRKMLSTRVIGDLKLEPNARLALHGHTRRRARRTEWPV